MNILYSCDSKNWWEVKFIIPTTYKVHPTYSGGLLAFLYYFNSLWGEDIFSTAGFCSEEFEDCGCHSRIPLNTAEFCEIQTCLKKMN